MTPITRFVINLFIFLFVIVITYTTNKTYFEDLLSDKDVKKKTTFINPLGNFLYTFMFVYLWVGINLGWIVFGIMSGFLTLFFMLLIFTLNRTGMGPPLAIISMFILGLSYIKLPVDEFKNSSNIEKVVHAVTLIVSGLMIYLYAYSPQPKMKGFALVVLVMFLNTIAILYGARNTSVAPGQKLARVFKWLIYVLCIASIVWYNTYGTVGAYTSDSLYSTFDPRIAIRDVPDYLNGLIDGDDLIDKEDAPPSASERSQQVEERGEESQKEERREVSQDYYD